MNGYKEEFLILNTLSVSSSYFTKKQLRSTSPFEYSLIISAISLSLPPIPISNIITIFLFSYSPLTSSDKKYAISDPTHPETKTPSIRIGAHFDGTHTPA